MSFIEREIRDLQGELHGLMGAIMGLRKSCGPYLGVALNVVLTNELPLDLAAEQVKSYFDDYVNNPWGICINNISDFQFVLDVVNRNKSYGTFVYTNAGVTIALCDYGIEKVWGEENVIGMKIKYDGIGICAEGKLFSYSKVLDIGTVTQNIDKLFNFAYKRKLLLTRWKRRKDYLQNKKLHDWLRLKKRIKLVHREKMRRWKR